MITTLTGANSFGLRHALQALTAAFVAEQGEDAAGMALERLDGEEASFDRLSEALTSLPFLADKKLVVLYTPGVNKQFTERAEQLLAGVPETTDVVLVEPKLDKRSAYYKLLKKVTAYQEFSELDAQGVARWAAEYAKAAGGSVSQTDVRFLVERVGANQQLISNEIDKLLAYAPQITRATIEQLTEPTPQSTVFELLEAAFSGNAKRAMALYDEQRVLKVEPQQIMAMVAWQLHVVALLKTAGGRTPDEVAKAAKISPFVAKKSASIARKIAPPQFKRLLQGLLIIDMRLKRESLDADEALRNYLLRLATSG